MGSLIAGRIGLRKGWYKILPPSIGMMGVFMILIMIVFYLPGMNTAVYQDSLNFKNYSTAKFTKMWNERMGHQQPNQVGLPDPANIAPEKIKQSLNQIIATPAKRTQLLNNLKNDEKVRELWKHAGIKYRLKKKEMNEWNQEIFARWVLDELYQLKPFQFPLFAMIFLVSLFVLAGVFGGVFLIPTESFIQVRPSATQKGQIWASANFMFFIGVSLAGLAFYLLNMFTFPVISFMIIGIICLFISLVIWGMMSRYKGEE